MGEGEMSACVSIKHMQSQICSNIAYVHGSKSIYVCFPLFVHNILIGVVFRVRQKSIGWISARDSINRLDQLFT